MQTGKIIYGIDLGTTNSAISRFENGKAVVKKSGLQGDTTPSCVAYTRNQKTLVGVKAHSALEKDYQLSYLNGNSQKNSFIEFKRSMGKDSTFFCSNLNRALSPEELSSEVLKELRKYIVDDDVRTAVITVPAMFDNTQQDATKRAARMAGFDHVELIQEPVAASVAYGLGSKMKNSYWLVFDFGGGTFDAALMKIEDGIMTPIDTAGNNNLGGKDIDNAILEEIFIPYFQSNYSIDNILATKRDAFKNMWKAKAEEAKIALSFNESVEIETDLGDDFGTDDEGVDFEMCMTITQSDLEKIAGPIYQEAVDITKELLTRNNLRGADLGALILVGGPTFSPIIRKKLRQQITPNVDTSIDPMTCVSCGAALYGSTVDVPEEIVDKNRDRSKVQIKVDVPSTTVETETFVFVALLKDKCNNLQDNYVYTNFVRTDGLYDTGKIRIDDAGDGFELKLNEDCTNVFEIKCYDEQGTLLDCEPSSISIIQGIDGIGDSISSYNLGVGVMNSEKIEMFKPIDGLRKGVKLPADGMIQALKTPYDIRPGFENDEVRISLYQIETFDEKNPPKALHCIRLYDVTFNGDDISRLLPARSEINIRMHAAKSQSIDSFIIDIPYLDVELDVTDRVTSSKKTATPKGIIDAELAGALKRTTEIGNEELKKELNNLKAEFAKTEERDAQDRLFAKLQDVCRRTDEAYSMGEWERQEKKLRAKFDELEKDNEKYGDADTTNLVSQIRAQVDQVIRSKNIDSAKALMDQIDLLDYKLAEVEYYVAWLANWHRRFEETPWRDKSRARLLINQGAKIIQDGPTSEKLNPIIGELIRLLPDNERPQGPQPPTD